MHGKEKPRFNLRSEYEKPRLMNRNKQVPISFGFREKPLQCVQNPRGGGGGGLPYGTDGDARRKF